MLNFKGNDLRTSFPVQSDDTVLRFMDYSQQLIEIIETRIFGGDFPKIIKYVTNFGTELAIRLTDEQMDEQLTFCSQYKFTFSEIRDVIGRYRTKIDRRYKVWYAKKANEARKELLSVQRDELTKGFRNKGNFDTITNDQIKNYVLDNFSRDYELWNNFFDDLQRAYDLMRNLADDLQNRSISLATISKRRDRRVV